MVLALLLLLLFLRLLVIDSMATFWRRRRGVTASADGVGGVDSAASVLLLLVTFAGEISATATTGATFGVVEVSLLLLSNSNRLSGSTLTPMRLKLLAVIMRSMQATMRRLRNAFSLSASSHLLHGKYLRKLSDSWACANGKKPSSMRSSLSG